MCEGDLEQAVEELNKLNLNHEEVRRHITSNNGRGGVMEAIHGLETIALAAEAARV